MTETKRILRSTDERVLAGVAGGLARYLNTDPTLVRLAFVAAAFFGGLGVIAYLVMAVVVPEDDGSGQPASGRRPPVWAMVLLAIAVVVVIPGPFSDWGGGWPLGFGLIWAAALLLAAAAAYRLMRGRWPGQGAGDGPAATGGDERHPSGEATTAIQPATASEATTRVQPDAGAGAGPPRLVRLLALTALVVLAIGGALTLAAIGAWATATGNGAAVAGVVLALGLALAATAFFGEAARRSAPWLLGLGLLLAIPAGAVAAADVEFDGGVGERSYVPARAADIPADGYELGVGQLIVDLRDLEWEPRQEVTLPADLGIGRLLVSVPSGVCVFGHADGKIGEVLVRGQSSDGVEPEFDRATAPATMPRLRLDADLQIGQLLVTDRAPDEVDRDSGPGEDAPDDLAPEPEACR